MNRKVGAFAHMNSLNNAVRRPAFDESPYPLKTPPRAAKAVAAKAVSHTRCASAEPSASRGTVATGVAAKVSSLVLSAGAGLSAALASGPVSTITTAGGSVLEIPFGIVCAAPLLAVAFSVWLLS